MRRMLAPVEMALAEAGALLENEARRIVKSPAIPGAEFPDSLYIVGTGKEAMPCPGLTLAFTTKRHLERGDALLLAGRGGAAVSGRVVEGTRPEKRDYGEGGIRNQGGSGGRGVFSVFCAAQYRRRENEGGCGHVDER